MFCERMYTRYSVIGAPPSSGASQEMETWSGTQEVKGGRGAFGACAALIVAGYENSLRPFRLRAWTLKVYSTPFVRFFTRYDVEVMFCAIILYSPTP